MATTPRTTPAIDLSKLNDSDLMAELLKRKEAAVPTLKQELDDLLTQVKEKITALKGYGESVSLVSLSIVTKDEDKDKVTDALKAANKAMGKSELAKAAGFVNDKGQPKQKFGKIIEDLEEEGVITVDETNRPHMVTLVATE